MLGTVRIGATKVFWRHYCRVGKPEVITGGRDHGRCERSCWGSAKPGGGIDIGHQIYPGGGDPGVHASGSASGARGGAHLTSTGGLHEARKDRWMTAAILLAATLASCGKQEGADGSVRAAAHLPGGGRPHRHGANADTLYTITWLDVSKEPWILSIPDMKDRYHLFPMLDGWTNVFQDPGKRTTGTKAQKYAITGPGWSGTLPTGITEYKSPTGMVWVLGRIYCTGTPEDYKAVHALQDQVSVVPLSAYGEPYTSATGKADPAIDMKPPRDQVNAMDGATYFKLFAELLRTNPPAADDASMVVKLAKIGIAPGQDFEASKLEPAAAKGIADAPKPAQGKISKWLKESVVAGDAKLENGWLFFSKVGVYGYELPPARDDHVVRPEGEPAGGRRLSNIRGTGGNQEVQRRQQVRRTLQQGQHAPGQSVLVDHDVRQGLLLRSQPDEPVYGELPQQVQGQCRRLGRPLHPARFAGQGQGAELASRTARCVRADDAVVLALRQGAIHPRRHVEAAPGQGNLLD